MRVRFRTRALESRALDVALAQRAWGPDVGAKYVDRYLTLTAAPNMRALRQRRSLRLHTLKGRRRGTWAIDLTRSWRLVFEYDEAENAILILEVADYHG